MKQFMFLLGLLIVATACATAPGATALGGPTSAPVIVEATRIVPQTVVITTTPAPAISTPASTATLPPTRRAPTPVPTITLDRHGCPDQADHFMNQIEYTIDQPNGRVSSPAGTNVGFIWGPNLVINGQNYGRKAVILTNPGTIVVSGAYRIRWHSRSQSSLTEYTQWAQCFVHKDEGVTYEWTTFAPAQVYGTDRHGCPDQADHFMNQIEYTIDQPNGRVSSPAGTNVGFIWGPNLVINGQNYGRKAVILTNPGTIVVSGAYRIRWHSRSQSSLTEYTQWAQCFVHKDEGVTYEWTTFAP